MLALVALFFVLAPQATPQSTIQEAYERAQARGVEALLAGRLDEGIAAFQECLELQPHEPYAAYNLACIHSRKGEIDAALEWLGRSIEWGFVDHIYKLGTLVSDADLAALRTDPRFKDLVDEAEKRMPAEGMVLPPPSYVDWGGSHRGGVRWGRFSPDGSRIVTSSMDGSARVFDSTTGELLLVLDGHGRIVTRCAFSPDGEHIVTAGQDRTVRFWDARTGERLAVVNSPQPSFHALWFAAEGNRILAASGTWATVIDASRKGWSRSASFGYESVCHDSAFDGRGERLVTAGADGVIRFHDSRSGELLGRFQVGPPVFAIALDPSGKVLAAACADGKTRTYEVESGQLLKTLEGHHAEVNQVAYDPGGTALVTGSVDRTVRVWDAVSGDCRHVFSGFRGEVLSVCFSPDGKRILATSDDGTAEIRDAVEGHRILRLESMTEVEWQLGFNTDGTRVIACAANAQREWDAGSGEELQPTEPRTVNFRQARQTRPQSFRCLTMDPTPPTAGQAIQLAGAGVGIESVVVSRDGRFVYSADEDDVGRLWNRDTGRLVKALGPLTTEPQFRCDKSRLGSAAFSSDGTLLATAQHADGAVRLWDVETGKELEAWRGNMVGTSACVVWADSRELLAVGRGDVLELLDLAATERASTLMGHAGMIQDAAFGPKSGTLATCSMDGSVRLWDLERNECTRVLRPLPAAYFGHVALSGDGTRLAAASWDHRVFLWSTETGQLLGTIVPGDEPLDWLAFAPSGHYHGTSLAIARARLVHGAISYPLSCFAAALESAEQVRAAFAGLEVEMPNLPDPPSLVVASPVERAVTLQERTVRVQALATDALAGLEKIDVVQDGSRLPEETLAGALTLENSERLARLDLRLPIPEGTDETRITLQAVSTRGIRSRPESLVVRYEPPKRELYVLGLGVADYADDALDLAYPVQDIDGLIARLGAQEGELFHEVHVERRADGKVTAAEVLRLRDQFLLRAKPDDTIVVFVAGHGVRSETGEYWFLTPDATPDQPYSGVKRADLESLVTWDKLHATKRVLLLDTCHSGAAFGKGTRGERGIAFQQSEVDTLLERSSGLYILAATSDDGFAREQEGNGLFTRALLDGLDGAADTGDFGDKDGTVGIDELMHFARYAVLERSEGRQQPTFPKIEGGENFPLARARARKGGR